MKSLRNFKEKILMTFTTHSTAIDAPLSIANSLNDKHLTESESRGLLNDYTRATCRSITHSEAKVYVGNNAPSAGILFMGANGQIQFKPDKPRKNKKGKPIKYESVLGSEFDALLPKHPTNKDYWTKENLLKVCYWINDHPYIGITEGGWKAIAGCANGLPTVALLGVEMGLSGKASDVEGKRHLVAALRMLAEWGFGFIIIFDADAATNEDVRAAERKLARQLAKFNVPVRSITGDWDAGPNGEFKGMDDFIQHKRIEEFRAILSKAKLFEEKYNDDEDVSKKKKYPAASVTAREIAEIYRSKLAWESEYQLWRQYAAEYNGLWEIATEESVRELIHCHLETLGHSYNAGYVSSVATILKSKLETKKWNEQKGLIPLRDGVLDIESQKLSEHSPGYRFTYQLPYKWADRAIGCAPIEDFLQKISGAPEIAEVLLAYLAAIVTGRADLQRYLELIGGGGTGKSTFMALATALIGEENAVASQLRLLESNRFETAKFYRKRLGLFPDSERWQGEVSILKQLTGQDPIRYERKGVQQCKDFRFEGMIILSANEAPESSDRTSGQERRKLTVGLETKLAEYEGRDLRKEFEPYLPGLLKRVLDIPSERIFQLIKHTERYVPALAAKKFQQLTETNPIAAWLDERVVIGEDFRAQVGIGNPDFVGKWLYANFCQYQAEMGHKSSLPMKRFSSNLRDLLKNQLKIPIIEGRDAAGSFIRGIGLRCLVDPMGNLPRPVTQNSFCVGFENKNAESMVAETLTHVGFDGFDGSLENLSDVSELTLQVQPQQPTEVEEKLKCEEDGEENQQYPSNPAQSDISAFTNPTQVIEQSNIPDSPPAETITTEDAEKIRDIAEVWWLEYYPDQLQNLLTQMFGWKSPGTKYKVATIENWLEGESETVLARISELLRLRDNS
jgi:putative DNA primase/helicase